jgi:hypothetical protein
MDRLMLLQIVCCAFMTGLIWLVQVVHYPGFSYVAGDTFQEFHRFHSTRITLIVGPVMLVELVTAVLIWLGNPTSMLWASNLVGVGLLWMSTFFLSVPYHNRLTVEFNHRYHRALVLTNWPRTIIWTLRTCGFIAAFWTLP